MAKKKVLITGATGFVGQYLVEEALKRGYSVHAGVRKTSKTSALEETGTQFFQYDFKNPEHLERDLKQEQFDFIIHNIGLLAAPKLEPLLEVNKGTLVTLVNALRRADCIPDKLILTSSLAAFGPADFQNGAPIHNKSSPQPVTNYGRSKLAAEQYLMEQSDIPHLIFRPSAVFGPKDKEFLPVYKTIKYKLELLMGHGQQILTFIYVKDLARLFIDSLDTSVSNKAYFVTDGKQYPVKKFNKIISKLLNTSTLRIKLPIPIVKAVAYISESVGKMKGKYPVLNVEKVEELKRRSWACNTDPIKKDFNFAPAYTLEEALKETLDWCKSQKLL